jgi:hypothetical protein
MKLLLAPAVSCASTVARLVQRFIIAAKVTPRNRSATGPRTVGENTGR